jgi:iron complex outermembrane receptor protein
MNLPSHMTFDATLRYVGALPEPSMTGYTELDARWGWHANPALELSLRGSNLLHSRHTELPTPYGEEIARAFIAEAKLHF